MFEAGGATGRSLRYKSPSFMQNGLFDACRRCDLELVQLLVRAWLEGTPLTQRVVWVQTLQLARGRRWHVERVQGPCGGQAWRVNRVQPAQCCMVDGVMTCWTAHTHNGAVGGTIELGVPSSPCPQARFFFFQGLLPRVADFLFFASRRLPWWHVVSSGVCCFLCSHCVHMVCAAVLVTGIVPLYQLLSCARSHQPGWLRPLSLSLAPEALPPPLRSPCLPPQPSYRQLEQGKSVNERDKNGSTALMHATWHANGGNHGLDIMRLLLDAHADVNVGL
jgi:hypothetical protein